jgi:putative membrane-bound dehydrogenase-like protein
MLLLILGLVCGADDLSVPRILDDRCEIALVAREPDIVTPTGVAVDRRGRVFVVECHTHFRPENYAGPPTDRILIFDRTGEDLVPKPRVFHEGTQATMNIGLAPWGDLYIATRQEIFRIRHAEQIDQAPLAESICRLDTAGNYPHNGLSGFAFDPQGQLWIGLGENLGAPYTLIAKDGTRCQGGGEGGSVYRLSAEGQKIHRVATGFWNPFHLFRSPAGSLWVVDNDPDARPPCRLLHLIEGGDYGFKFRYGRNGLHPFHAWNGELPGTLPMAAGTGEAPSGIAGLEGAGWPIDLLGQLVVTSWGDNRVERFQPQSFGSSFRSTLEPWIVGTEMFRPVGIALGLPGELFISDWVDRSYELHGKGRLWRVRVKKETSTATTEQQQAFQQRRPAEHLGPSSVDQAKQALIHPDPFARARARLFLGSHLSAEELEAAFRQSTSSAKVEYLLTLRDFHGQGRESLLAEALTDADPDVRLVAVQWIGDRAIASLRPNLDAMLSAPIPWTRPLLESTVASLELLERRWAAADAGSQFVVRLLDRPDLDPVLYRFALRSLPPTHPWWTIDRFRTLVQHTDVPTGVESIRSLRESTVAERDALLTELAGNEHLPPLLRSEAILGLQTLTRDDSLGVLLVDLSQESEPLVAQTALRVIERGTRGSGLPSQTIDSVQRLLEEEAGDGARGERLFFDPGGPGCYRCHQVEGRGGVAGPDLSTIARGTDRSRLLRSVLEPSREMAPRYVPWLIATQSGQVLTGILVREGLEGEQYYVAADSKEWMLRPEQIEERRESSESIMPRGLLDSCSPQETRDLIAYLESLR